MFGSLPTGLLSVAQPVLGHLGVMRVNDLAEPRELGEQRTQVAVLLAALEHADRLQRAVRPSAQQADVGEAGPDSGSRSGAELLAQSPLFLLQARHQRDDGRLDGVEQSRELARRHRGNRICARGSGPAPLTGLGGLRATLHDRGLWLEDEKITTPESSPGA